MARNWTPEERAKQAEKIRAWKPWEKSTGPRTETGKRAMRANAYSHGFRSTDMAEIRALLRNQRDFVKLLLAAKCARKNPMKRVLIPRGDSGP